MRTLLEMFCIPWHGIAQIYLSGMKFSLRLGIMESRTHRKSHRQFEL
jgi:hypothetical protein